MVSVAGLNTMPYMVTVLPEGVEGGEYGVEFELYGFDESLAQPARNIIEQTRLVIPTMKVYLRMTKLLDKKM
jgi:hypothetical protein